MQHIATVHVHAMTRFEPFVTFVGQITSVADPRTVLCEVNFRKSRAGARVMQEDGMGQRS
jgi:hypothetical protein